LKYGEIFDDIFIEHLLLHVSLTIEIWKKFWEKYNDTSTFGAPQARRMFFCDRSINLHCFRGTCNLLNAFCKLYCCYSVVLNFNCFDCFTDVATLLLVFLVAKSDIADFLAMCAYAFFYVHLINNID